MGGHDGEGHRGPKESPEAIRKSFLEMSQAGPSSPMGIGDYGSENQPLDGDSNHFSSDVLQIKTQTCDIP